MDSLSHPGFFGELIFNSLDATETRDKRRPDGPLSSCADFALRLSNKTHWVFLGTALTYLQSQQEGLAAILFS